MKITQDGNVILFGSVMIGSFRLPLEKSFQLIEKHIGCESLPLGSSDISIARLEEKMVKMIESKF